MPVILVPFAWLMAVEVSLVVTAAVDHKVVTNRIAEYGDK